MNMCKQMELTWTQKIVTENDMGITHIESNMKKNSDYRNIIYKMQELQNGTRLTH